jgi:cellulose synthase/poly-beta-1,6-N-acetylglucosamine synthase-like glycosyltransferase
MTIVASIRSLLALRYPEFEVIVVNDGSTDGTLARLTAEFNLTEVGKPVRLQLEHKHIRKTLVSLDYPNLLVMDKENGGKADALNAGINASEYPLFCSLDADSLLEKEALLRSAQQFVADREIVAAGGIVRILNGCTIDNDAVTEIRAPKKYLECLQAVEYVRGFLSGRTAWNVFGSLLIISGAFGLFRKDMVLAVNGYRHTVGEDMDLVIRLHRHCLKNRIPYKVMFVPDPVCFTQAPTDLDSLLKQRNRWQRGLIDSLWFSRGMLFNAGYGVVGLLAFPYFLFVEALGPMIECMGYVGFVLFFLSGCISSEFAFLFFVIAVLWGMWINVSSILLDNILFRRHKSLTDVLKLCLFSFVEMLGYRQLITIERFTATFAIRNKGWGKPKRKEIRNDPVQECRT